MSIVIETSLGDITVDLFLKERPKTCLNFIKLCKLKYYNFNLFHTIEQGFIAQTGDPTGAGDGGSSVWGVIEGKTKRFFEAETLPKIKHSEPGLLSMVGENNMIGSQFFFTLGSDLISLDGKHCVIGEVTEGHDVLRKISEAICDEKSRPYQDIRITHTVILEDPFSDPRGFREPSRSPSPNPERLKNGRIAADEDIDDTEGKTEAEIQEMLAEREAKARATILEIVGDIPDAEIAPPENVLFVCKLNPVTTDDDLKIIFSRFGKIKTCEVIRDKQSGDSLQYAFIEFEERKACEDAYFKMDNVLIDDRRIHVDFSQSVSKIKWRGKGNYEILEDSGEYKSKKLFRGSLSPSPERKSSR
jgi:peptidyl-prolyl cis-trans isomerase-like 4